MSNDKATVTNYSRGNQRSVARNAVTFLPGDVLSARLRGEYANVRVVAVQGLDTVTVKGSMTIDGELVQVDGTYDSDYFYINRGVDETDAENFDRRINYLELTR